MRELPEFVLERARDKEPVFSADEVAAWPDGLLEQLVADGVLKATSNAATVTCNSCGHDHVETVEYIQSPPGTNLRAYISCPENGRVRVPFSRLRRWNVNRERLPVPKDQDTYSDANNKRKNGGRRGAVPKRSWTQLDLDDAIRAYKARRASRYGDLVDGVQRGQQGARKAAREIFGRNALVRVLGVRSPAMVTNSPAWQEIADELRLRDHVSKKRRAPAQRIGIEIAQDEQAVASGESVVDEVVRRETVALVEKAMPALEAEATIEKLQRGEITDDQARELVNVSADQKRDDRMRRIRQGL